MSWLINLGYWGLFIGTYLAGTILPFSSDVILVSILTLGARPWLSLAIATAGNWMGLLTTYGLGWIGKWEWLDRWFNIKPEKLREQKKVVDKYGVWIALFTWIPVIGIAGLIGLGFYKVKPKTTILLLVIGCFSRYLLWTILYVNYGQKFVEWIMNL